MGPAGMPAPIVALLNKEIRAALEAPDLKAKFEEMGVRVTPGTPEQFAALFDDELKRWGNVIRAANIKPE